MKRVFKRTLPPAASPLSIRTIWRAIRCLGRPDETLSRLQSSICRYFGVRHCFLFSSGKTALTVLLRALHLIYPHRNEVLIPAYTCYSVPSAILRAGLSVRLCDTEGHTFNLSSDDLRREIYAPSSRESVSAASAKPNPERPPKLLAIMPTHLYGLPAEVDRLRSMIPDEEIIIIEDAAQAMGSISDGRYLGVQGDVGFFSLGRGKAVSAVEGGILITDRDDIAGAVRDRCEALETYSGIAVCALILEAFGLSALMHPSLFWLPKLIPALKLGQTIFDPSFNMRRMSAFQAGLMANWQLDTGMLQRHRQNWIRKWTESVPGDGIKTYLHERRQVPLPDLIRYPLHIKCEKTRQHILRESERQGLGIMAGYPDAINNIPEIAKTFVGLEYPNAQTHARQLITLPVHSYLKPSDVDKIVHLLSSKHCPE